MEMGAIMERTLVRMGICRFGSRAFGPMSPFHGVLEPGKILDLVAHSERAPEPRILVTYHLV